MFFEQKTQFLALFKEFCWGKIRKMGEGGTPQIRNSFFADFFSRKGGWGTPLTDKIRKVVFDVAPKLCKFILAVPIAVQTAEQLFSLGAIIICRRLEMIQHWKALSKRSPPSSTLRRYFICATQHTAQY